MSVASENISVSRRQGWSEQGQARAKPSPLPQAHRFDSLGEALRSIAPVDGQVNMRWHDIPKGAQVKLHYHPQATEWIVFEKANFDLTLRGQSLPFDSGTEGWNVIKIEPGVAHGLRSREANRYFVVRDRDDKTIAVDESPLRLPTVPKEAEEQPAAALAAQQAKGARSIDAKWLTSITHLDPERAAAYLRKHRPEEAARARAFLDRLEFKSPGAGHVSFVIPAGENVAGLLKEIQRLCKDLRGIPAIAESRFEHVLKWFRPTWWLAMPGVYRTSTHSTPVSLKALTHSTCPAAPRNMIEKWDWLRAHPGTSRASLAHVVLAHSLQLLATGKDLFESHLFRTREGALLVHYSPGGLHLTCNPEYPFGRAMAVNWPASSPLDLNLYDYVSSQMRLEGLDTRHPPVVI